MSASSTGISSAERLIIRFSHGSLRARNSAIRMKGAPNVPRDSKAPPAHSDNPSNARVRALPSACRKQKAKKSAPSDKARPQIMASLYMERFPRSRSKGEPNANPITYALPSQLRTRDESGDEHKAVRIRPAKADNAMTPAQNPEIRDHFPCPGG